MKSEKVDLIYGESAVRENSELIRSCGRKFMIVCGRSSARLSGALDDVLAVLADRECIIFDRIGENPKVETILEAGEMLEDVDCVIGIGGGSALDAAKVIACLKHNDAKTEEGIYGQKWENGRLPLILIGTTAGTGSEVTKVAVLSKANGRKSSIHNESFYADVALCDPAYTASMPEKVRISTAVDALTHCNESYFSNKATDVSRGYAIEGIRLLLEGFKGMDEADEKTRDLLYRGSLYGGLAIDVTGTTFAHNVGYYLTEEFHVPHGFACAIFQEDLLRYEFENSREYAQGFFDAIGMDLDAYASLINAMIPDYDIRIGEDTLEKILPRWEDNGSVKNTYGKMGVADIERILRERFMQ